MFIVFLVADTNGTVYPDLTGEFPIHLLTTLFRSLRQVSIVYTVTFVSDANNLINTCSLFFSELGIMSSFSSSVYFCVEFIFFRFWSKCTFSVSILGVGCFATSVVLIPGHVTNCSFLMAFNRVNFTGLNNEACRKCMISFLVAICSKLQTIFSPSEVGMYCVSPSEVTNGIFHKVFALSRSPWRINFPLWCMLQCF